jgi:hypothetical protein
VAVKLIKTGTKRRMLQTVLVYDVLVDNVVVGTIEGSGSSAKRSYYAEVRYLGTSTMVQVPHRLMREYSATKEGLAMAVAKAASWTLKEWEAYEFESARRLEQHALGLDVGKLGDLIKRLDGQLSTEGVFISYVVRENGSKARDLMIEAKKLLEEAAAISQ